MRISSNQIFQQSVNAMLDQQAALNHTQLQVSTGRRILTPSDDPAGAAQILDLNRATEATAQYQRNADAARQRLGLEDNTLGAVTNLLHRVRELAVQANNGSQSNESRSAIAAEIRQRLDELLALANTQDANNEYLFAGFKGQTQPFARSGSNYVYQGDPNTRFLQIGPSTQVPMGDSGADVFQLVRNGNGTFVTAHNPANTGSGVIDTGTVTGNFVADTYTIDIIQVLPTDPITYTVTGAVSGVVAGGTYTDGGGIAFNGVQVRVSGTPANGDSFTVNPSAYQDMFTTLDALASVLETPVVAGGTTAGVHNRVGRAIAELDQALGRVLETRAAVGARLNVIDSQKDINEAFTLYLKENLSGLQDLDYAEAVSRLNQQLLSLQAAQQAFVKVQGLSLFNFLR